MQSVNGCESSGTSMVGTVDGRRVHRRRAHLQGSPIASSRCDRTTAGIPNSANRFTARLVRATRTSPRLGEARQSDYSLCTRLTASDSCAISG